MTISSQAASAEGIEVYNASGRIGLFTIPIMLVPGLALGVAAAFGIHQIWQWTGFYLIWFFPVGIGLAAGFGMSIGGRIGRNRSVPLGLVLGLAVGIVSYGSMHYFDAVSYGTTDILAYLRDMAQIGYSFFFIPISGPFAWISWIVELGIVIFFSTTFSVGAATVPYCETCNQWTTDVELFSTHPNSAVPMLTSIRDQRFHLLKEQIEAGHTNEYRLKAQLDYCENCKRTGYLTLSTITPTGDKDETEEEVIVGQATAGANVATLLKDFPVTPVGM
ncbi:MAG: hypothetical protein O6922_08085 [Chloroflexi bacterium]|nr:hypothetical protein [Chloroflexota bacterium]